MHANRSFLALALVGSVSATAALADAAFETTSSAPVVHAVPAPAPLGGVLEIPEDAIRRPEINPFATGCSNVVGYLGSYGVGSFQWDDVLLANGLTLVDMNAAGISPATLAGIDVLMVDRTGAGTASANAATLDTWIRGGGVMMTEFTATQIWYNPGPLNYLSGSLVSGFYTPSGTVCGGNLMVVNEPGSPLATDLPPAWECSGDPLGVFQTFTGIDPQLCVIVSMFGVDNDGDGVDDPAVAMANIDAGVIVPVFSDFGDFQALEDPRVCPPVNCQRTVEDEAILVNIACRATGCVANEPPTCDAGPEVVGECREATIDGATAEDLNEEDLTWEWSSDNPDVSVSPASGMIAGGAGALPIPAVTAMLAPGVPACGVSATLTLTVTDTFGAESTCETLVTFEDTEAPSLVASSSEPACIWPPNHKYVCLSLSDISYVVADGCGEASLTILGCSSDQPDEAPVDDSDFNGDGNFENDCVLSPDATQVCVRAERAGGGELSQGGRSYSLLIVAEDECGNVSEPIGVPLAHVAHDQSEADSKGKCSDCLDPNKVGIKHDAPFPWEPADDAE